MVPLDALADELGQAGVTARGIRDQASLTSALDQLAATLGPVRHERRSCTDAPAR